MLHCPARDLELPQITSRHRLDIHETPNAHTARQCRRFAALERPDHV